MEQLPIIAPNADTSMAAHMQLSLLFIMFNPLYKRFPRAKEQQPTAARDHRRNHPAKFNA
jgi:hypothetical protein